MADYFLVCPAQRKYMLLGKWLRPQESKFGVRRFAGWGGDPTLGRLLSEEETRIAIVSFLAQTAPHPVQILGFNDFDAVLGDESIDTWHRVQVLKELLASQPDILPTE